jgi:hypothetical protein
VHGCKASTSKSTRIIEPSLLAFVRERVLTPENLLKLLTKADAQLKELSLRPKVNTAPLQSKAKSLGKQIDVLVKRVASAENDELRESYDRGIAKLPINVLFIWPLTADQTNRPVSPLLRGS